MELSKQEAKELADALVGTLPVSLKPTWPSQVGICLRTAADAYNKLRRIQELYEFSGHLP